MATKVRKPASPLTDQLKLIAGEIEDLETMDESVEITRYVPTIIPGFNRAIVLGGAPLGAIWAVHGEYAGGKSSLGVILIRSFVETEHLGVYIDAEHAASKKWFRELGADPTMFLFYRPLTLEDMADMVDAVIDNFDKAKKKGDIPHDKGLIIVLDSINKLTPKSEFERVKKEGADALDKGLARFRGLLLQTWLDRMTPIIGRRDIALVLIAQEREKQNAKPWEIDFKVKGCQGLMYDASVQMRVKKGVKVWEGPKDKKILVGFEHQVNVLKNKVGFPMERFSYFTSNGKGEAPIGLDMPRTVLHEAMYQGGIFTKQDKSYYYEGQKWVGEKKLLRALREDPDFLNDICITLDRRLAA